MNDVKYKLTCTCGYDIEEHANFLIKAGYKIDKCIEPVGKELYCDEGGNWYERVYDKAVYYIHLEGLDRLNNIADITGHPLIVSLDKDGEPTLEIYDDYRE